MLRDLEQPDILLKLIKGLSEYDFQLVYNQAQLNTWSTKTLILAGYIDKPHSQIGKNHPDFLNPNCILLHSLIFAILFA